MSEVGNLGVLLDGITEMVGHFLRQEGGAVPSESAGYVDVLGDRDVVDPHRGQRVFVDFRMPNVARAARRSARANFLTLRGHGPVDDDQRVIRWGQFISVRKPEEGRVGR